MLRGWHQAFAQSAGITMHIENIYGTSVGAIIGAILCITPNLAYEN